VASEIYSPWNFVALEVWS